MNYQRTTRKNKYNCMNGLRDVAQNRDQPQHVDLEFHAIRRLRRPLAVRLAARHITEQLHAEANIAAELAAAARAEAKRAENERLAAAQETKLHAAAEQMVLQILATRAKAEQSKNAKITAARLVEFRASGSANVGAQVKTADKACMAGSNIEVERDGVLLVIPIPVQTSSIKTIQDGQKNKMIVEIKEEKTVSIGLSSTVAGNTSPGTAALENINISAIALTANNMADTMLDDISSGSLGMSEERDGTAGDAVVAGPTIAIGLAVADSPLTVCDAVNASRSHVFIQTAVVSSPRTVCDGAIATPSCVFVQVAVAGSSDAFGQVADAGSSGAVDHAAVTDLTSFSWNDLSVSSDALQLSSRTQNIMMEILTQMGAEEEDEAKGEQDEKQ